MQRGNGSNKSVTLEDQTNINKFSRLNNRRSELKDELKEKKKELEDIEYASDELMISDDTESCFLIGRTFVHMENDSAEERLSSLGASMRSDVERLEGELKQVVDDMSALKKVLYERFGSAINLEEED